MQHQEVRYVPKYRFVDTTQAACVRSQQSHVQREASRMRHYQRRKGLLDTVGQIPWVSRQTSLPAIEEPKTNSGDDDAGSRGSSTPALIEEPLGSRDGSANRCTVSQPISVSENPILDLGVGRVDPFEAFVVPNYRTRLDALLNFRKFKSPLQGCELRAIC